MSKYRVQLIKWLKFLAIIFLVLVLIGGLGSLALSIVLKDRILPNVYVGNYNLGGLTLAEAQTKLEKAVAALDDGLILSYHGRQARLQRISASADPDLSGELYFIDSQDLAYQAWSIGRGKNPWLAAGQELSGFFVAKHLSFEVNLDTKQTQTALEQLFGDLQTQPQAPKLTQTAVGTTQIQSGQVGLIINQTRALASILTQLKSLQVAVVTLNDQIIQPTIISSNPDEIKINVDKINHGAALLLQFNNQKIAVNQSTILNWLRLDGGSQTPTIFDTAKIIDFLLTKVAPQINQPAAEPRFTITNGRVGVFVAGQSGQILNATSTATLILQNYQTASPSPSLVVNLAVDTVNPQASGVAANDLAITEIVGSGSSNFAGSPKNRRHNIQIGAAAVNGTLIAPSAEFSLLKTLGTIDASTGYLTELVIKEGKTLPEYGGGLCQIGTTAFRAAVNSGLPITERRNHSYRVGYYEPAGTDATIYDPSPDFRFSNDTGHYLLFQTKIDGDNLTFDLWGTKDGRVVTVDKPTIFNITDPGPTKIVESLDLAVGEKKCVEKAHKGADAYFDYHVTYPDGHKLDKRFNSHYVPWQEVCLVGVAALSQTATSSPSGIATTTSTPTH